MRQKKRQDGDGNVDEKDPAPIVVVRDPSSQGWADDGCGDDGQPVDGEGLSACCGRKRIRQNRLLGWLQSAPAEPLDDTKEHQHGARWSKTAPQGTHSADRNTR